MDSNGSEIILHILVHYVKGIYNWQVNLLFDAIFSIEAKQNLCDEEATTGELLYNKRCS